MIKDALMDVAVVILLILICVTVSSALAWRIGYDSAKGDIIRCKVVE